MAKLVGFSRGRSVGRGLGATEERKQAAALIIAGVILGAVIHQLVKGKSK